MFYSLLKHFLDFKTYSLKSIPNNYYFPNAKNDQLGYYYSDVESKLKS